eukprot:5896128-Alexandrium_andersonii.AAC.1
MESDRTVSSVRALLHLGNQWRNATRAARHSNVCCARGAPMLLTEKTSLNLSGLLRDVLGNLAVHREHCAEAPRECIEVQLDLRLLEAVVRE